MVGWSRSCIRCCADDSVGVCAIVEDVSRREIKVNFIFRDLCMIIV